MPYAHYGRIGDVWKHLPLCSILSIEKPRRYIETNSAGATYSLGETPEQKFGIYYFYDHAGESPVLLRSPYLRLLRKHNAQTSNKSFFPLRSYLGSPGLAMNLLKDTSEEFIFFDIERLALESIRDYAGRIGLLPKIRICEEDSVSGVYRLLDSLGKDDFIHFDPYSLFESHPSGLSYWDVFQEAARRGIKGMLWYAFFTEREKRALAERFRRGAAEAGPNSRFHAVEVFLDIIRPDTVIVNPGVVGCGVLMFNLSPESHKAVDELSDALILIYEKSVVFGAHPGKLRSNVLSF